MTYNVEVIDNQVVLKFGYNGALPQTFVLTPDQAEKLRIQIAEKLRIIENSEETGTRILFKEVLVGQSFWVRRYHRYPIRLTRISDVYDTDRMLLGKSAKVRYNAQDEDGDRYKVNLGRKVVIVE